MIKQTNSYKASELVEGLEVVLEARVRDSQVDGMVDKGVVFYKDLVMGIGYYKVAIKHGVGQNTLAKPVVISHDKARALVDSLNDNARWNSEITLNATSDGVSFLIDGTKGKHFSQMDNQVSELWYEETIEGSMNTVSRKFGVDSLQDGCYNILTDLIVINEGQLEGITEDGIEKQRKKVDIEYQDTPFVPVVVDGEYLKNIVDSISLAGESEGVLKTYNALSQVRFETSSTTHILMPVRVPRHTPKVEQKPSKKKVKAVAVPF